MGLHVWWKKQQIRLINWWPPFLFTGIRVTRFGPKLREIDVALKMHWWNRNYVNVHFGGSLYAMTDPFYMLMLMENLGRDFIVWDKAASIRFKRPGKGTVTANFKIDDDDLKRVRDATASGEKYEPVFTVQVKDQTGVVVAEVDKVIYVKRKDKGAPAPNIKAPSLKDQTS